MAKRVAERELTDRNWDQEDEVEEAGSFAVASKAELQKRQIKTAKRSGATLGAGAKGSNFSGFGGFSFKPTQTSTPFSVNVKSFTNGKMEKPGQDKVSKMNGEPEKGEKKKDNDAEHTTYMSSLRNLNESVLAWIKQHVGKNPYCILTPIFTDYEKHIKTIESYKSNASFTKSPLESSEKNSAAPTQKETQPSLSSMFKPAAGTWTCDTCLIQNKGDFNKCVACQTAKPGAGASSSLSSSAAPAQKETQPSLSSMFKPAAGTWTCDTCLIQNKGDVNKCVACQTAKPGAGASSSLSSNAAPTQKETQPSLSSMFKPAAGTWTCDTCLIQNKGDVNKCVACQTAKPGAGASPFKASGSGTPDFKFGNSTASNAKTGSGFKINAGASEGSSSTSGFSFGTSENKTVASGFKLESNGTSNNSSGTGFTFGTSEGKSQGSGFAFGKSDDKLKGSGFTFGKSEDKSPASGFTFGKSDEKSPSSGFSFGKSEDKSPASGFTFGKSEEKAPASKVTFGKSEDKSSTTGFTFGKSEEKSPASGIIFGKSDEKAPTSGFIFGKGDDKSSNSGFTFGKSDNKAESPGFSFGKKEENSTTSGFAFGKSTTDSPSSGQKFGTGNESSSVTSGFSFGTGTGTAQKPGFSFGAGSGTTPNDSTKGFSFAPSTSAAGASAFGPGFFSRPPAAVSTASQDEEEYEPPKVESTEVAEEGSLYSVKCKLFYQRDGKWNEKGVGFLHLKKPDGKTQLVVRADTNLGNILMNIMLSPSIPLKRQGTNNVYMMCVPNPKIKPKDEDNKPVAMLIRVKNAEAADQLLEKMEELRKE